MGFAEIADGTLIETIEDPSDPKRTLLATWNHGSVSYRRSVLDGREALVPLQRDDPVLRWIRLPRGARPYASVSQLAGRIEELLARLVKLRDESLALAVAFVLSSWIADRLPTAPYLMIVGPVDFERTVLLEALALVCRRPVLTGDFTVAGLYRACERVSGTLLVDEAAGPGSRDRSRILRLGTRAGFVGLRRSGGFSGYGAKAISVAAVPRDRALWASCIAIPMSPLDPAGAVEARCSDIAEVADDLQQRLLMFRFENYKAIRPASIPGAETARPEAQGLLSSIAAPFPSDARYHTLLLGGMRLSEERFEPLDIFQRAVMIALFFYAHAALAVTVGQLAKMANLALQQMGEAITMKDRQVGAVLDTFDYYFTRPRGGIGYRITLDNSTRKAIHQLAHKYSGLFELDTTAYRTPRWKCKLCREQGIFGHEEFRPDCVKENKAEHQSTPKA